MDVLARARIFREIQRGMANPDEVAVEVMTAALPVLDEGGMSLAATFLQHSINLAVGAPTLPAGGGLGSEAEAFLDE